jgi:hypothetical protein
MAPRIATSTATTTTPMSNRLSIAAALILAVVAGLAWGLWCYRQMQVTSVEMSRPGLREAAGATVGKTRDDHRL